MPSPPTISIAVLPFDHLGTTEEGNFLSDGLTEEIIYALTKIPALRVTSRVSSFFYKDKHLPLAEIAEQLGVGVILTGSIQIVQNNLRVSAQLLDATHDDHFWSERWDRVLDNFFAVQEEISLLIADKLREQYGHLTIDDQSTSTHSPDLSAYALSLRARQLFNQWNPADCQKAIDLFQTALQLDDRLVSIYVGLADAYSFLATTQQMPRTAGWELAMAYTKQGLAIDAHHPGLHYLLANQAFFVEMDFPTAVQHTINALEYDPSHGDSRLFLAFLYTINEQWELAEKQLQEMLLRDPHNPETHFYTAHLQYYQERFNPARRTLQQLISSNPYNVPAQVTMAYCLLMTAPDEALEQLRVSEKTAVPEADILGIRCLANFAIMADKVARKEHEQIAIQAQEPEAFQAHIYQWLIYIQLGAFDAAFTWLETLITLRSSIVLLVYNSPLAKDLRKDDRFLSFQKRLFGQDRPAKHPKGKKPLVNEALVPEYQQRIKTFMEQQQPYLNPALSLRSLAAQVEIHPNQLSWVLNESFGQNFNTFVNSYRIAYFKRIANQSKNQHLSLLGLAFESGFNSKTAFNGACKQITGMTPSQYLKS